MMVFFIYLKMVSITFFTDCCAQNFFFIGESACFHSMNSLFDSGKLRQTYCYRLLRVDVYGNVKLIPVFTSKAAFVSLLRDNVYPKLPGSWSRQAAILLKNKLPFCVMGSNQFCRNSVPLCIHVAAETITSFSLKYTLPKWWN